MAEICETLRSLDAVDDIHAPASYRQQLATVLPRRALLRRTGVAPARCRVMSETRKISVTVNNKTYDETVPVRVTLADFLRHQLRLTGTHLGCEHGVCGACTILFDGHSARSCLMLAVQADGHDVADDRRHRTGRQIAAPAAGGLPRQSRPAMRLLYAGNPDHAASSCCATIQARPKKRCGSRSPAICAAAPAIRTSSPRRWMRRDG